MSKPSAKRSDRHYRKLMCLSDSRRSHDRELRTDSLPCLLVLAGDRVRHDQCLTPFGLNTRLVGRVRHIKKACLSDMSDCPKTRPEKK